MRASGERDRKIDIFTGLKRLDSGCERAILVRARMILDTLAADAKMDVSWRSKTTFG